MENKNIWHIVDDCEQFIAKCKKCGHIEDTRNLPKICPKCASKEEMENGR